MTTTAPTTDRLAATLERLVPELWSQLSPLPAGGIVDLPMGQARVLGHLALMGRRRVGELAEELGVKVPTITGIVARLEERGLVERRRCPDDRRVVWVVPRPEGERLAGEARALRRSRIATRLRALSDRQQAGLLEALGLLEQALGRGEPLAPAARGHAVPFLVEATPPPGTPHPHAQTTPGDGAPEGSQLG